MWLSPLITTRNIFGLKKVFSRSMNYVFYFQGAIATFLTMPLDVMKTRMMNAKPGTYAVSICVTDERYNL